MKKRFFYLAMASVCSLSIVLSSCDKTSNDPMPKPTPEKHQFTNDNGLKAYDDILFPNNVIGNGDKEVVFKGKQTLKKGVYTLKGWVYVADGAVLTIEPGTIIKGDKASKGSIIVERGGKLIAKGTSAAPIVFTSAQPKGQRKPGDWGGIILCGKAKNNQSDMQIEGGPRTHHGGQDDTDNSGVLSYVRIEFAGYPFEKDKEINGLTLGSVGSNTQIDHVQVSYSNDDSFEWFGGTVDCKYLISYKSWDDDFDTDDGFRGHVQFGLVVRDSRIADASWSNGFESDNDGSGSEALPTTAPVFSNISFFGPKAFDANFNNTTDYINGGQYFPNNNSSLGRFQAAMQIRRSSQLSCFNSLAIGYPVGIMIDNGKGHSQDAATAGKIGLQHILLADVDVIGSDKNKSLTSFDFSTNFFKQGEGNAVVKVSDLGLKAGQYLKLNCIPTASVAKNASFSDTKLSQGFDKVSYIGAFGNDDNWLQGWTNFDPNNTDY